MHTTDYDQDDELVDWEINCSSHRVFLLAPRSTDKSRRPREQTLNTDLYHVFDILAYDPSRGALQWVGYGTSEADITREPVKKVKQMEPDLMDEFIEREGWARS
ncbi:hypothetical protein CkaCkLH20_13316 [Colletotrichum karsti]|uniref:Uncharacterized protein n=1 Tax=Colletotrichum karsti TaxID=1095194 RepID=A0A9P6LEG5_9PEZI|nr:uncharacterized protein CkaCkLH20_13316 [Colletotrichum karsti]KAF9869207.1 hypothetical protein CkaCkLH20_13316 [Colletotrichum karsti]